MFCACWHSSKDDDICCTCLTFDFPFSSKIQNDPRSFSLLFVKNMKLKALWGVDIVIFINGWTEWPNHCIVIFNPPSGHLPLTTNKENAPYSASSAFLITNQLSLVDMTPIMKGTSAVNVSSLISSQRLKWKEWASHSVLEAGKQGLQELRSSKRSVYKYSSLWWYRIFV